MAKPLPVSPLAPKNPPRLPPLPGVEIAVGNSGTRYQGRPDVLLMRFPKGTTVAGLLTRSSMPGAPVDWCRKHLSKGKARALVVNAGNANVFTGKAGRQAVEAVAAAAAKVAGCSAGEVMLASTGVIGQILPHDKIAATVTGIAGQLAFDAWRHAAETIRTTDTFAKVATATAEIGGVPVRINGFAKGSGMIAPDMATMLCFVATDAKLPAEVLQALLTKGNELSFNCLTVDGDTSTSDTLLMFATGQAKHAAIKSAGDAKLRHFVEALNGLLADLAEQVARDGEGAKKLVTINVTGAANAKSARRIALAIANSPLVKTAIAGEDANWGRIVMAVGKSGEKADRDKLVVSIGGQQVTQNGMIRPGYDEAKATMHLRSAEVSLGVDVGIGKGAAKVWTCDLTHGYIDINADYRS
jgi:glutamate N-acetyltransferase/amino-acid N-acetyltransferase